MSRISVIVPVYNIEDYISKCLESIINQTFKDIEIIIVDDGSTDNSGKICDKYKSEDNRITVIHKQNEGLVRARKTGLYNSSGEYVIYIDGDDWIDNSTLEKMYEEILANHTDMVVWNHFESIGNTDRIIKHGIESGLYNKDLLIKELYPCMISGNHFFEWKLFPSIWEILFKRDLLEKAIEGVDDRITMGEDAACVYPAALMADSIYISNERGYHYRQTSVSMIKSRSSYEKERERYTVLYENVLSRLKKLSHIYDVTEQWNNFILFSMIPRSDQLFDGIENLEYVFPFPNIKKKTKIALYGAGTYGQLLYEYFKKSKVCEVVIWVDRNYINLSKQGLDVKDPAMLTDISIEGVIIASMFTKDRTAIRSYIESLNLSVPVGYISDEFVHSEEIMKGFRLHE